MPVTAVGVDDLYRKCDPEALKFSTTEDLDNVEGLIGQERALAALEFGSKINQYGFNLFVLGLPGSGKHMTVRTFLERKAQSEPTPADWVYVFNFDQPNKPRALSLPPGQGRVLKDGMAVLIDELQTSIPAVFESDEYLTRRKTIEEAVTAQQQQRFKTLQDKAREQDVTIIRTPAGFAVAPAPEGKVLEPEVFNDLPEEARKKFQEVIERIQIELQEVLQEVPKVDKERREKVRQLNQGLAQVSVSQAIIHLDESFLQNSQVSKYLHAVRKDLVDNIGIFAIHKGQDAESQVMAMEMAEVAEDRFVRYEVNVLVCHTDHNGDREGAPVIYEDHPSMGNLVGRMESMAKMGALVTSFDLLKPGVLQKANGGYLLLDARKILSEPMAWDALKRSLQAHQVKIESLAEYTNMVSTVSLEPDPIPLNVKVVLFGDRQLYYTLSAMDPDFGDLFKVAADFDDALVRSEESSVLFARLIATLARQQSLKPVSSNGVARMIEHAARLADDSERLSLRVGPLSDIIQEADYWAAEAGRDLIDREDVDRAIDQRLWRLDRMKQRSHEAILRDIMLVDTGGAVVGQINGLSVMSLGNFRFGKPTRITASVRMGGGKVIDIEREVDLGGPLHSKGVLILSSYLAETYVPNVPFALRASLVFEQSYGGVDGDSASSTELYALLSALSGAPIKQGLAVTGAVNQKGQVQAIGGVNEKIEGFFDICKERGLTGKQGVLIPGSNVEHLMLRRDVVEACERGEFTIYPIETIEQGIEVLTGWTVGERGQDGIYPEGTLNHAVESRLIQFATAQRSFGKRGQAKEPNQGEGEGEA